MVVQFSQTIIVKLALKGWNTDAKSANFYLEIKCDQNCDPNAIDYTSNIVSITIKSPAPTISTVTPSSIHIGDQVEITGTKFGDIPTLNAGVRMGGCASYPAKIVSWSDTKIVAQTNQDPNIVLGATNICIYNISHYSGNWNSNLFPIQLLAPVCTADTWSCGDWNTCSSYGSQTRSCTKTFSCPSAQTTAPATSQSCTPPPPPCSADVWSCGDWSTCSVFGNQTRFCAKTFSCPTAGTPTPMMSQSCTPPQIYQQPPAQPSYTPPSYQPPQPSYTPPPYQPPQPSCSADTWSCDAWGSCSPDGIQSRSCRRIFKCPGVETAAPVTSQFCQAPNRSSISQPPQAVPEDTQNQTHQDQIIKATVKLICSIDSRRANAGTGTIIDSSGIILTNRHVVDGTRGCHVGFITTVEDEPSYTHVADIARVSGDREDIALLKIRKKDGTVFPSIDISKGNVSSQNFGARLMIYGYPGIGGSKLNFSDGAFSGFGSSRDGLGDYLKTNAFIEQGNSGGGAYLNKDGSFIGIPSAGIRGELASIGYILSINKIKQWLSSSGLAYTGSFTTTPTLYTRASATLESVDVGTLQSLDVSQAKVSIYADSLKTTLLANNPGTIQISNRPTFTIQTSDQKKIAGYYFYFGQNIKADPQTKGRFMRAPLYVPQKIRLPGTYYFIFRAKDKSGNVSSSVITEYRFKK